MSDGGQSEGATETGLWGVSPFNTSSVGALGALTLLRQITTTGYEDFKLDNHGKPLTRTERGMELGYAILVADSHQELCRSLFKQLQSGFSLEQANLVVFSPDGDHYRSFRDTGRGAVQLRSGSLNAEGHKPWLDGMRIHSQRWLADLDQKVDQAGWLNWLPGADPKSCICLPLWVEDSLLGVFTLEADLATAGAPGSSAFLRQVAEMMAIAVRKIQFVEALRKRTRTIREPVTIPAGELEMAYLRRAALAGLEMVIREPLELQSVMDRIAQVTTELLPATGGASVILWDAETEEFYTRSTTIPGQKPHTVVERVQRQSGVTRWIVDHKEPLVVSDVEEGLFGTTHMLDRLGYRAYVGVPMLMDGDVVGVLYAVDLEPRAYSEEDLAFLTSLANRGAVSLFKVLLIARLQQANALLELRTADLEAANKELREFAFVVSHDLKTPLRGVHSLARWLAKDYGSQFDQKGQEAMDLLVTRVTRMNDLIEGILQYSRVGSVLETRVKIDLAQLIAEVIDSVNPPESIEIVVVDAMPEIYAERTRFVQLFQNLISNAVRYMDKPQGRIEIGCSDEAESWQFHVRDNGRGIEASEHQRIFELFETVELGDEVKGTGIGLAIVSKIISKYHGQLWLESEPGIGTTFYVSLPRASFAARETGERLTEDPDRASFNRAEV